MIKVLMEQVSHLTEEVGEIKADVKNLLTLYSERESACAKHMARTRLLERRWYYVVGGVFVLALVSPYIWKILSHIGEVK